MDTDFWKLFFGFSIISLVLIVGMFFLLAVLLMVTYNNSITKMNPDYQKIDNKTSMVFTLFVLLVGSCFRSVVKIRDSR